MPNPTVVAAFENRLKNEWANYEDCPLVNQNEVAPTPARPPFIEIEWPAEGEKGASVGTRFLNREFGGARFVISVEVLQQGWRDEVLAWIEEIRDLFRNAEFDGVETFEASPPVIHDRNKVNGLYRVPFVVRYKFDSVKG